MRTQAEVVVVGSGPGGAAVARQLSRAGRKVILLECGRDYRREAYYGTYLGALIYTDRHSFLFTKEGLTIVRPLMVGGATSMYCGSAARPPPWLPGLPVCLPSRSLPPQRHCRWAAVAFPSEQNTCRCLPVHRIR